MSGPKYRPHSEAEERIETEGTMIGGTSREEKDACSSLGGGRRAQEVIVHEEAIPETDPQDSEGQRFRELLDRINRKSEGD